MLHLENFAFVIIKSSAFAVLLTIFSESIARLLNLHTSDQCGVSDILFAEF